MNDALNDIERATQTQLENIQKRSGKTLVELRAIVQQSRLAKHGRRSATCSNATWAWATATPT